MYMIINYFYEVLLDQMRNIEFWGVIKHIKWEMPELYITGYLLSLCIVWSSDFHMLPVFMDLTE